VNLTPRVDDYTGAIIEHAVESLTNRRGLPCPDDPGVRLHTLASLAQQIHFTLTNAVIEARRHDYSSEEIAEFLGTSAAPPEADREENP
jgi:cation transport regulator ChaB